MVFFENLYAFFITFVNKITMTMNNLALVHAKKGDRRYMKHIFHCSNLRFYGYPRLSRK